MVGWTTHDQLSLSLSLSSMNENHELDSNAGIIYYSFSRHDICQLTSLILLQCSWLVSCDVTDAGFEFRHCFMQTQGLCWSENEKACFAEYVIWL